MAAGSASFQPHRLTLEHDSFVLENRRGRTSHEHFPALITGSRAFSEMQGEVWGVHLAWSGNHRLRAEVKTDGRRYLQAEALYLPGEMALAEGETLVDAVPVCQLLGEWAERHEPAVPSLSARTDYSFPGQQTAPGASQHLGGDLISTTTRTTSCVWPTKRRPRASSALLSMTAGLKGRNDDWAALGDWYLDEKNTPYGLTPVIDHVKSLGMEFGIWVEPEMINPDSDLYRAHPDWVLALPGYTPLTGRHQFVLNLNIPEAFDYLLERMSWLLGEHAVDYVKWDMNRELVQPGIRDAPLRTRKRASSTACWIRWWPVSRTLNLNPAPPAADGSIMKSSNAAIASGLLTTMTPLSATPSSAA